jgi:hypothetical protein
MQHERWRSRPSLRLSTPRCLQLQISDNVTSRDYVTLVLCHSIVPQLDGIHFDSGYLDIPRGRFGSHVDGFTVVSYPVQSWKSLRKQQTAKFQSGSLRYLCNRDPDRRTLSLCHTAFATDRLIRLGRTCGAVQEPVCESEQLLEQPWYVTMCHSPEHGWGIY